MSNRSSIIKMGEHIAELRKSKGLTQKNLGDILDISDKTVSKWEQGLVAPDITILNSLASTLGITIEELLLGEEVEKDNTVEAIEVYSNITKRKMIKVFIIILVLILAAVVIAFRIESYYKWHVTSLFSDGDIQSRGYLMKNEDEARFVIDKIYFSDGKIDDSISGQTITKVKFELINNDKIIYDKDVEVDEEEIFKKVLESQFLIFDYKGSLNIGKITLRIIVIDDKKDEQTYLINY